MVPGHTLGICSPPFGHLPFARLPVSVPLLAPLLPLLARPHLAMPLARHSRAIPATLSCPVPSTLCTLPALSLPTAPFLYLPHLPRTQLSHFLLISPTAIPANQTLPHLPIIFKRSFHFHARLCMPTLALPSLSLSIPCPNATLTTLHIPHRYPVPALQRPSLGRSLSHQVALPPCTLIVHPDPRFLPNLASQRLASIPGINATLLLETFLKILRICFALERARC